MITTVQAWTFFAIAAILPLMSNSPSTTADASQPDGMISDCVPGNPRWTDDESPEAPFVLLDPPPETGGNANGPGCDGCTVWASGTVFWSESGVSVIAFPDGSYTTLNVVAGEDNDFGGGTYKIECEKDAEWDFVSPTSGGRLTISCSKCQ
jgi:hypothetical protein